MLNINCSMLNYHFIIYYSYFFLDCCGKTITTLCALPLFPESGHHGLLREDYDDPKERLALHVLKDM